MLTYLRNYLAAYKAKLVEAKQMQALGLLKDQLAARTLLGHAYGLSRLRKASPSYKFRGKFVGDDGLIFDYGNNEKATFTSGFVIGPNGYSLWVGETTIAVRKHAKRYGIVVSNAQLVALDKGEIMEVTFPDVNNLTARQVYALDASLAKLAVDAGLLRVGSYWLKKDGLPFVPQEGDVMVILGEHLSVYPLGHFVTDFGMYDQMRQAA